MQYSALLEKHLPSLLALKCTKQTPVLDLACGNGRNGLYLINNNINVTFADINGDALKQVEQSINHLEKAKHKLANYWQVDFEQVNAATFYDKQFSAIVVFRYLHRALFTQIKAAIKPGGLIVYETFTEQQAEFGRPKNPNFLLKPGELADIFSKWKILYSFEGIKNAHSNTKHKQAIAQIVALKPD